MDPSPATGAYAGPRSYRASLPFLSGTAVLCASFLINTLAIAAPLTALLIYDRVLANESRATLAILAVGAVVVILAEALLRLIRAAIISRASAHADFVARNGVVARILEQDVRPGSRMALSELNGRLSAVGALRELRLAKFVAIVDLPFALAFLVLVGLIGGTTVALPIGACTAFFIAILLVSFANERSLRGLQSADRRRWAFTEAVTRGLHSMAAIASQVPVVDKFIDHQLSRSGSLRRQSFVDLLTRDVTTTFSQVLVGSVVVAGALAVLNDDLSLGGLAACTLLAGRALEPLQNCLQLLALSRKAKISRDDLVSLPDMAPARHVSQEWDRPPQIRFDAVNIAGPGGTPAMVTVADVTIPAGTIATISGDRGVGKTSLGLSILGMAPFDGHLSVGGIDAGSREAYAIRAQASYLPRLPQLPAGRLLDILTDGSETRYADVRYLAHLIGLDETVKRLPAGYDTILRGGGASELSTGIQQQIAICRLLARKQKLLVADDATCVLDAATELRFANIVKMLAGEATVILLTDRPSLKAIAARRFDLSGGCLTLLPSMIEVPR